LAESQRDPAAEGVEALEVRLFLEAINARYGYDLRDYAAPSITRRVLVALAKSGLPDLGALQHRVLVDPALFTRVLTDLTVPVSELFRDPSVFEVFRSRIVPVLRTYPFFNIWHAGCSTGEEAYSTAIVLREEGLADRCQIYATDLSASAIEHAKQGVYEPRNLAAVVERYERAGGRATLESHATVAYGQVAMTEALRSQVLFFQHNLVSDHAFAEMTVVFCRNVLIYFGRELRQRVVEKIEASLSRGAFLCLGGSERLAMDDRAMFGAFAPDERIYRYQGAT
jgi:chemotaxis protein methyltransferase CheR